MKRLFLTVVSFLVLSAAAQGSPQAAAPEAKPDNETATQDPSWFVKLLDREAEPSRETRVTSDDGRIKALVAAVVLSGPELISGDYFLELDIGAETSMECWIYPRGHDMAAAHRQLSEQAFKAIAQVHGGIESKLIERIDAGAFGAHPYLALDWLYRVKTPQGGLAAGQIKHLAAFHGESSVYCRHNETGYRQTFERVFRGLVEHLEVLGTARKPYFQEVTTVALSDLPTGVAVTTMTLDADGNTRIVERMSLLILVDQQTLVANDSYNIQLSTADGLLTSEVEIDSVNGEITSRLRLEAPDEEGWKVSGRWASEDLESSLGPKKLMSILGQRLALRRFFAQARTGSVTKFADWTSDADPEAFTEIGVQVLGKGEEGVEARFDMGPRKMDAVLDENASVKSALIAMGSIKMRLRRVYVSGGLSAP